MKIMNFSHGQQEFLRHLGPALTIAGIFDHVHNAVFSIKDLDGRYLFISTSCVDRCGLSSRNDAIGRTSADLFPPPMAERYAHQDARLFACGDPIIDSLDLTLYPDRSADWCITTKLPLRDRQQRLAGLACLSVDVGQPGQPRLVDECFAAAIEHIHTHFARPIRIADLVRIAGMSPARFERRMKRVFQLAPHQYLLKVRIDRAVHALATTEQSISSIALMAGFCDQSAFSRKFKATVGMTPKAYRRMVRNHR